MELKNILFIIIAVLIAVFLFKMFMWLLPVFIGLAIGLLIYIFFTNYRS